MGTTSLEAGDVRYKVDQIIVHEKYWQPQFANDIALIRVHDAIELNDKVQPIELETKVVPPGTDVELFG